jgi:NitT/TauT family transport system substrate-binding protein
VASDAFVKAKPEVVRRMVEASRRGWETYLLDPTRTNERLHVLNPEMGLDILRFGVDEMQSMTWLDPETKEGIGRMTQERWQALVATMEELKLVPQGAVKPGECFHAAETANGE